MCPNHFLDQIILNYLVLLFFFGPTIMWKRASRFCFCFNSSLIKSLGLSIEWKNVSCKYATIVAIVLPTTKQDFFILHQTKHKNNAKKNHQPLKPKKMDVNKNKRTLLASFFGNCDNPWKNCDFITVCTISSFSICLISILQNCVSLIKSLH